MLTQIGKIIYCVCFIPIAVKVSCGRSKAWLSHPSIIGKVWSTRRNHLTWRPKNVYQSIPSEKTNGVIAGKRQDINAGDFCVVSGENNAYSGGSNLFFKGVTGRIIHQDVCATGRNDDGERIDVL